jgi:predicted negative regulator of RcsB-dependent stress response
MFRSYDTELQATNQQLATGNVDAALTLLEKNNTGKDKDLLYYFEKGELLRAKGDLTGSQAAWRSADLQVYSGKSRSSSTAKSTSPSSAAWSTTRSVATKVTTTKKSC